MGLLYNIVIGNFLFFIFCLVTLVFSNHSCEKRLRNTRCVSRNKHFHSSIQLQKNIKINFSSHFIKVTFYITFDSKQKF